MLDFSKLGYVPKKDSELYNLTIEYLTYLLENLNSDFQEINSTVKVINENLVKGLDLTSTKKKCFRLVESFIDNYGKLIKSTDLSLGQNVGKVKSKEKIFEGFEYKPNKQLQDIIVHGLRNTNQHFEERLQYFSEDINPFQNLHYENVNLRWEINFGRGGYTTKGHKLNDFTDEFDISKLFYQSYRLKGKTVIPKKVSISEIWYDVNNIFKLIEMNVSNENQKSVNKSILPPRNMGLFESPFKNE